jgi:molecular chaperone HtpG
MSSETRRETHVFQTEVKQLLHLMIHSLYSNREIFLRELISNASDANDRLRFAALSNPDLMAADAELTISVDYDKERATVTVTDTGIGMSREELIEQLGTIARSGTASFLAGLSGDQKNDSRLIGQFGVGFYSSFMVADRVEVLTRKAGLPEEDGVRWDSTGAGEFTIEPVIRPVRGTTVILHLKDDQREFGEGTRLRYLIRKFSDHIAFPVRMKSESAENPEAAEWETVNSATALWTVPRAKIADAEYKEFYKHIAHDFEDPLSWSHNRVEGKREYTSLLYIPSRAPFDLWQREAARGLKLYVQRVFIMDDAEQFLPMYLRFVRGIVDAADLPLNVSRELLQGDPGIDAIRTALTHRVLGMLEKMASDNPDDYTRFWNEFGQVLKEAPAEDAVNSDRIARLLRFASTSSDQGVSSRSLQDYVADMKESQKPVYYLIGESEASLAGSPHLETFRNKDVEVLLLSDRIDEWLVSHLREFDGHPLVDISRGDIDLGELESEAEREQRQAAQEKSKTLIKRMRESLGERVEDVRVSSRLDESPACLVRAEHEPGAQMRKILASAGQHLPAAKPILEINPEHLLISKLDAEQDEDRFHDLTRVLFDQANLVDGGELADPSGFVKTINKLLVNSLRQNHGPENKE